MKYLRQTSHEGVEQYANAGAGLPGLCKPGLLQIGSGALYFFRQIRSAYVFRGTAQIAGIGNHVCGGRDSLAHFPWLSTVLPRAAHELRGTAQTGLTELSHGNTGVIRLRDEAGRVPEAAGDGPQPPAHLASKIGSFARQSA